jgi:DNA-binding NtrC family response regulator
MTVGTNAVAHPLEVLVAEDDSELCDTICEALEDAGHSVQEAADGATALGLVGARHFDVLITDIQMPKLDGLSLFKRVRQVSPDTEVIIMTSHSSVPQVVAAMKDGAYDYLAKPFLADELVLRVARIAEQRGMRRDLEHARAALSNVEPGAVLVGQSLPVRRLLGLVDMVARADAATLITGESGTGKELVARMLHDLSPRRDRRFVVLNCGALTETLVEAELFGHERGAFTGADRRREGRFAAANGGTLFLDEIAELPMQAQAKLLRVLQEGTFEPLGSTTTVQVDVRIVSATHRDLAARIRDGQFREDLLYRINGIQIAVPPLRDRPGDLALLVQHFLRRFTPSNAATSAFSPEAWAVISQHAWPGNVRELSHAVQHAVVMSGGGEIQVEHLPPALIPRLPVVLESPDPDSADADAGTPIQPLGEAVRAFERSYLARALARTKVKRGQLAAALGISRKTLWEKVRAYGIEVQEDREGS